MARASELPGLPTPGNEDLCRTGRAVTIVYEAVRDPTPRPEAQQFRASARVAYHFYVCHYCRRAVHADCLTVLDHFAEIWAEAEVAPDFVPRSLKR